MSSSKLFSKSDFVSLLFFVSLIVVGVDLSAQSFSQNSLNFNGFAGIGNGTSLMFGPDGRLYVSEYTGPIKIYTVERVGPGDYVVQDLEVLNGIEEIQDHNDDGSLYSSTLRETIGLTVTGTASNPVFYVTSSDFRIGGGANGEDEGLDTNSGIITRFSWTGTSWDVVDIVRGLPRSEENHATNGLEFVTINGTDYLIVAQGGHTNAGGPSNNFAFTTEYALSAAVLSINLSQLEGMPILDDNGRKYIYDIPTLDDPTRANLNGIVDPDAPGYDGVDINDPFGGNDGLNQAMIVPGGPVQIFSPGYRNAFDLVVTESGAVYVTDNGANGGWGGFPVNEGGGLANNEYDPSEPGSTSSSDGEQVNNKDHLSLITTDIQTYQFGSFYGGHPTPVRANPNGAGLYTNPSLSGTTGAVFRNLIYHPTKSEAGYTQDPNIGLPANWPPVPIANPVEGDWRGPGINNPDGPVDLFITTWGTNTNAIDEYTASNFSGAMKGDLLAGVNTGEIRRVELTPEGTLETLTPSFISGLGGNALGVTCNSDDDIFPGTVWIVTLDGNLTVMEPQDFDICILPGEEGYDPLIDNDFDGYSNQDEVDNGTDVCNGGSQPQDFDKAAGGSLLSDLNDLDDDGDGILDSNDPFQLGDVSKPGTDAFSLPVNNQLFSSNSDLKGYLGLGMTGLMNNGDPTPNWLNWLDRRDDPNDPNPNDILGGAIGAMTMHMTSGTAFGTENTQEKGFQYGVQTDVNMGIFTVTGGIFNFSAPLQLYGNSAAPNGELGFFIGDGTQSNYIKFIISPQGLRAQQEINDIPEPQVSLNLAISERPASGVKFYFVIDPVTGIISLEYILDNDIRQTLGSITAKGTILEAIQQSSKDLAVGFIGSSNADGVEVEGTWDFLNVTSSKPSLIADIPDLERTLSSPDENLNLQEYFTDDQGAANLTYTIENNTDPSIAASISANTLSLSYPSTPAISTITIRATDNDANFVEDTFTVTVTEEPLILYRVNAGGALITSIDSEMDWSADNSTSTSAYLSEPGTGSTYSGTIVNYTAEVEQGTTPLTIFNAERYDGAAGAPNLTYSFPVTNNGNYEVRLYMGNGWSGTSEPGTRVFDVSIEGVVHPELNDIDLSATFGHQTGGVITKIVNITDGVIDISLLHGVQNPLINGIEILSYSGPVETPIEVLAISDQLNTVNEELDGSLAVSASGGEGNLTFSMEGAPEGVTIEPTNGQIGGTIAAEADLASPYTVTVFVNDSDGISTDEVSTTFYWTIIGEEPVVQVEIPDLERSVGSPDENLNLDDYFKDDQGVANLTYTVENNTDPSIVPTISAGILSLKYPSIPATSSITIRATDSNANFAEDTFTVKVIEESFILYRLNAGGSLVASIDSEMDWAADSSTSPSPYLTEPGTGGLYSGTITNLADGVDDLTTPLSIYNTERFDGYSGLPNLTYSFPVNQEGNYEVRLYMGNGWNDTSEPGTRIFDVSIEGITYSDLDDLDLSATFGHQTGGVISKIVKITDGAIDISFIHGIQNPLINGIEIINAADSPLPIEVLEITDQQNYRGEELDGSLVVQAMGGEGSLVYTLEGAPPGVSINTDTGAIEGIISSEANISIPYQVRILVDDSDSDVNDIAEETFIWTITETPLTWMDKAESEDYTARHECSFVQAGDKFYLIGGRENAKTLDIYDYSSNTWTSLADSAPFEFNHYQATEYQGLIWVIGAFKTNGFPQELPAEHIWAFDPAVQEWIQVAEIPVDRRRGSAGLVVYNDKFYITGGNTLGHDGGYVSWFDEFDPATGIWTSLADAPRPRDHFHAAVIDDKLYLAGGRLSGGAGGTFKPVIPEVDVYNFSTGNWITLPPDKNIPTPRAAASTVNFHNKLVVIGGEVENELVYGTSTSDALKITEEYDPVTGLWTRLSDLNFERHGTQAIVSGEGIFTLAGSPNKGGGSQKNMEYLGVDAPVGEPSVTSNLSAPTNLLLNVGSQTEFELNVTDGNVGVIIKSMVISGLNADNFQIVSGGLSNSLLKQNATHKIVIEHDGSVSGEIATLTINYGANNKLEVPLETGNLGSVISITSPLDQASFISPATIEISADASDPNAHITSVEFFEGANSLGVDSDGSNGWSFTWNTVPEGAYVLTAVATDEDLATTTSSEVNIVVSEPANVAPSIVLTSPASSDSFTAPADISITADATDTDGNVVSVEFFEGANSLGVDSDGSDGWSFTWNTVPEGAYVLTAVAIDEDLATTTSSEVNIVVGEPSNVAPSVAITSPASSDSFTAPADILITADATDTDGNVVSVEFFEGANSLGVDSDGSDGWSYSWNAVPEGTYELTAVATDDDLVTTTSGVVNISVAEPLNVAPSIAITSPANNDSFTAPADILITANATDTDGTVVSVEFFEGTNSLGVDSDGSDGWSFTWNTVPEGAYVLTAVAIDEDLATTASGVVNINIEALPSITNFIPSTGPVGSLVLINGTHLEGVTEVLFGPQSAEIISTSDTQIEVRVPSVKGKLPKDVKITLNSPAGQFTSFNKFTVTPGTAPINAAPVVGIISPANNTMYTAPAIVDILVTATDSDGTVTKVEFFNGNIKLGEDQSSPYEYQWNIGAAGIYTLTAIATDDKGETGTSEPVNIQVSDPGGNLAPEVSITSPVNNESYTAPANILITADAFDTDGSIASVEFYNGTTLMGVDVSIPYEYSWSNVPSGTYSLTAIATDDLSAVTTSEVVYITVDPSLTINAPSGLTAQWVSNSEVSLSWHDNHIGEDGFVLERASKSDFTGRVDYISLPSNSVAYHDTNLNNKKGGGVLYYRIKAVKGNLSSEYSNVAQTISTAKSSTLSMDSENADAQEFFIAYPNPTSGEATLEFLFLENINYSLRIYNSGGGFIAELGEGKAEAGVKYYFPFDGNGLSDGVYLIHLETSSSLKSLKIVIER